MSKIQNCSIDELPDLINSIDPNSLSDQDVEYLKKISLENATSEQAIKLVINSIYGAFANEYFHFYNVDIAETITMQGQHAIKYTEKMIEKYFQEFFHKDTKLHAKLGVPKGQEVPQIKRPVYKYCDTDSFEDGIILTSNGPKLMSEWYKQSLRENGSGDSSESGHESTTTKLKVANYKDGKLYFAPVKRLIKHKVSKPKWKIKTSSGKEVIVTNDHSMVVFRDGNQLTVKPSEIKSTDKILVVQDIYKYEKSCKSIENRDN